MNHSIDSGQATSHNGYDPIDLTLFPQSFHFSELDVWRATLSQEADSDAKRAVHTIAPDGSPLAKNVAGVRAACRVLPLPTVQQLKRCAAAASKAPTQSSTVTPLQRACVWLAEQSCPSLRVLDAGTKHQIMTIENPKTGCFPTAISHAPCTTLFRRNDLVPIPTRGRLEDFLGIHEEILQFDFVWVGFSDGSIRIFYATGNESRGSSSVVNCKEGDFFFVYELPKSHVSAVTGFALPPAHYVHNHGSISSAEDLARPGLAANIFQHNPDPADHLDLICSASADSCTVVWNALEIYKEIAALHLGQERLQERARLAAGGEKWQRLIGTQGRHLDGFERSGEPVRFQFADSASSFSFCAKLKTRYVMKLKGSVAGIRSIRWASTCVTSSPEQREERKSAVLVAKQAQAAAEIAGDNDGDDADPPPLFPVYQTHTRAQRWENRRKSLNLTEQQMIELDAKQELVYAQQLQQGKVSFPTVDILPQLKSSPGPAAGISARKVHFIICGDDCGYVLIWHLDDELTKNVVSRPGPARQVSPTPSMQTGDARSVATKAPKTDALTRTTDKKILFTGGVPISGLAVLLPPVVYLPHVAVPEQEEQSISQQKQNEEPNSEAGALLAPRDHPLRVLASLGETISESAALFHAYDNLELIVAVEGSVQFLSCHPTKPHEETDEDLQRLVKQAVQCKQQAIQSRRADENELVGSLDFPSFSVYFAKRVLEYMPQPVTNLWYDQQRKHVWVSRSDGVTHIYSSLSLRIVACIPHPSATAVVDPPHHADILIGIAQYSGKDELRSSTELGKDLSCKGFITGMLPVESTVYTRFVAAFLDNTDAVPETVEVVTFTNVPRTLQSLELTEDELAKQIAVHRTKLIQREESVVQERQQSFEQKLVTARSTQKLDSAREWFGSIECGLSWINRWKEATIAKKAKRLADIDSASRVSRRHRAHVESTELHVHILQSTQAFQKRRQACSAILEVRWRTIFLNSFFAKWLRCATTAVDRRFDSTSCAVISGRYRMLTASYFRSWLSLLSNRLWQRRKQESENDRPRVLQLLEAAQLRQRCSGLCEAQQFQMLLRNDYARIRQLGIGSLSRLLATAHLVFPSYDAWGRFARMKKKARVTALRKQRKAQLDAPTAALSSDDSVSDGQLPLQQLQEQFDEWSEGAACVMNVWESESWAEWTAACYAACGIAGLNQNHFERKKEIESVRVLLEDRQEMLKRIECELAALQQGVADAEGTEKAFPQTLQPLRTVVKNVKHRLPLDCVFDDVFQQEALSSHPLFPILNPEDDFSQQTGLLAPASQQTVLDFSLDRLRCIVDGLITSKRQEAEAAAIEADSSPNTKAARVSPTRFVIQAIQLCDFVQYVVDLCPASEAQISFTQAFDTALEHAGAVKSGKELAQLFDEEACRLYPVQPLAATLRRHASPPAPPSNTVGSTLAEPMVQHGGGKGKKNRRNR